MASARKRVLVAESDDIVLALISHILTRQGYVVDLATTAEEADARLKTTTYDAVLIDTKLSGGGVEWLRRLALNDPAADQRLVILTPENVDAGIRSRAVLRKPIEFGLLVETVAACVTPSS